MFKKFIYRFSIYSLKFPKVGKRLNSVELENFLSKFNEFDRISKDDAESIAQVLQKNSSSKNNYHCSFY